MPTNRSSPRSALLDLHGGLHLRDTILWLDAWEPRPFTFVSHAGAVGALEHQKILCTSRTAELLGTMAEIHGRGRRARQPRALVTPCNRPFLLGQLSLELFNAGHVLGSASLLVQHRGLKIVYAGEVNPRRGFMCETLEIRRCDLVALPARFGARAYRFPPLAEVGQDLVRFVDEALTRDQPVVLFCPPLGEAQEVARLLHEAGLPMRAHRRVAKISRLYRQAGFPVGRPRNFSHRAREPQVLIWPIGLRHSLSLRWLRGACTALVSGLAQDPEQRRRMACDAAFPLSCSADHDGLIDYIRACQARTVVLQSPQAVELRQDLQALGLEVSILAPPQQMSLF